MAITRMRESQVLDSDFLSEQELQNMKGSPLGVTPLDLDSKVPLNHLPPIKSLLPLAPPSVPSVLGTDGSSIYWTEDLVGGGTSIGGVPVEPYYFDSVRNRFLAFDTKEIVYYLDGTGRKNMFMYNVPGVFSNLVPYNIIGEYCIIGWDFFATSSEIGIVANVLDSAGNVLLPISIPVSGDLYSVSDIDILVKDKRLSCYVPNNQVNTPVVRVYMKKTYYPII